MQVRHENIFRERDLLLSLQVHQLVLKDVLLIMYFQMEQQKEMHRLYGHT